MVLKTLFYKNYFFIFFTPSIRFPPCKEVHPLKCSLEKLYGGEGRNHIYILKPTPTQKRTHPRPVYAQKTCRKLRQQSSYCTPHAYIILGGELLLMSKGDFWFCILYALKRGWNAEISTKMSLNVYFVTVLFIKKCWNFNVLLMFERIKLKCIKVYV